MVLKILFTNISHFVSCYSGCYYERSQKSCEIFHMTSGFFLVRDCKFQMERMNISNSSALPSLWKSFLYKRFLAMLSVDGSR